MKGHPVGFWSSVRHELVAGRILMKPCARVDIDLTEERPRQTGKKNLKPIEGNLEEIAPMEMLNFNSHCSIS